MGFYIRKSFSFGPVRLNLSKSGLGMSFGVKGARVSTGPRGTYFHAGRGGLYYRKKLGGTGAGPSEQQSAQYARPEYVTGEETPKFSPEWITADTLLREVNEKINKWRDSNSLAIGLALMFSVGIILLPRQFIYTSIIAALCVTYILILRRREDADRQVIVSYDDDEQSKTERNEFLQESHNILGVGNCWQIFSERRNWDWKREAGAYSLVRRAHVRYPRAPRPIFGFRLFRSHFSL